MNAQSLLDGLHFGWQYFPHFTMLAVVIAKIWHKLWYWQEPRRVAYRQAETLLRDLRKQGAHLRCLRSFSPSLEPTSLNEAVARQVYETMIFEYTRLEFAYCVIMGRWGFHKEENVPRVSIAGPLMGPPLCTLETLMLREICRSTTLSQSPE